MRKLGWVKYGSNIARTGNAGEDFYDFDKMVIWFNLVDDAQCSMIAFD